MPQNKPDVDHWEFERETKDLIPLTVETLSSSGVWTETSGYDVQCVALGTRPASGGWTDPTVAGGYTGYLVNGPTLAASTYPADYVGFYRLVVSPEDTVEKAFTLKLL